jgi:choline kinase
MRATSEDGATRYEGALAIMRPSKAIILAAGMGIRLNGVYSGAPKGLLPIGGEPILTRSLRQLREHRIDDIVLVVGYEAEQLRSFARAQDGVRLIENPAYAEFGSLASLACALAAVHDDFLLVESDLVYESRALSALLEHPRDDVLLASGPTGAGDEVWIDAQLGLLRDLSKDRTNLRNVVGEFTGLTRVSPRLADQLRAICRDLLARPNRHADYDVQGLARAAVETPITVELIPDLLWGEIDDVSHFYRVRDRVFPEIERRARAGPGALGVGDPK